MRLLSGLLRTTIRNGSLRLIDAAGQAHLFQGAGAGPEVTIRLHDAALHRRLGLNPELVAGEAYMDGSLTVESEGGIHQFLTLFSVNRAGLGQVGSQKLLRRMWRAVARWRQTNPIGVAAANARHHYDVPVEVYRLFLDEGLNYSCAVFEDPERDTLERAQQAKLERIIAKLRLAPGMRVAEIGSGWGSLSIMLARHGAAVTAVNVSPAQIAVARQRAEAAGLADRIEFRELDYRRLEGRFDHVTSVGMMEHVGIGNYEEYFGAVRRLLAPGGFAMIHSIGRMTPPGTTGPFIYKYIFPGGYVPALSEVFAATERTGMWVADMEVLRLHYYHTIRHWRARFAAQRDAAQVLTDERFCRMWEFYLSAVELGFLHGSNMVFQLLLAAERDAVPILRDYIADDLRALRARG
ncbi:MAG: cyclopropane-fatty-acyl-phospholipid synthase family protein [Acetobacteraceae bacterium]|nr:cyclopropane-fatty-acyl-phospholipid synthase family protein [Acetobacteraceae bacterium]